MIWYCEFEDKQLPWATTAWPTYCPLCGKAVNRDLSTHHWIRIAEETAE